MPFERIALLYMRTIITSTVQKTSEQKISSTGFLYSTLEFSMQANVAHDESCLCMPGRIVHLRHYKSLQLWELWNSFKESLPKATSNALDKVYLATTKWAIPFVFHTGVWKAIFKIHFWA